MSVIAADDDAIRRWATARHLPDAHLVRWLALAQADRATLVHMADNLGARMGSFDRLQKSLSAGEEWSAFDKGLGAGAFFPVQSAPLAAERRAA